MSKVPSRFTELENVQVYVSDDQVVITGIPNEDDEEHNCDVMGCSSVNHVLYRFAVLPSWQKVTR